MDPSGAKKYSVLRPYKNTQYCDRSDALMAGEAEVFGQPEVSDRFPGENPNDLNAKSFAESVVQI